ncbi:VWA domain-containing protein [Nocardia takedensis]|uniref:VWA domain-containing protein n=1 Tax=Nocardia takedensis TaxID=259390 RepID=UPI00059502D6|nr:VWA domain-containing protein [Nocardia takedensis]
MTHVLTDPTIAPAPVPDAWKSLSAVLTAQTRRIAGRADLKVTIAPGAGLGHPAVFLPARAAIEMNGDLLPVDPATARPVNDRDRARYPAVWGAFIHECAHARHSVWQPPYVADPAVVDAAMLLEESRIERAQVRRRRHDRKWLRASATEFIIGDSGGADAIAATPMTVYAAAHAAGLILARVDARVLAAGEVAPAAAAIEAVLGETRLADLRAIWRDAHKTADDDTAAMLELGRRWVDIVGPDPQADPEPGSALGDAIAAAIDKIVRAVAEEFDTYAPPGRSTREPRDDERAAARVLARGLDTAAQRERVQVKSSSLLPPGRVRMRGAMARAAQQAAGAIPTAEMFTRTHRKPVQVPPLRIGIACDISGSMRDYVRPAASAAWIIAHAAHTATMPAQTATVTFGERVHPITRPGIAPARVTDFGVKGAKEVIDEAIDVLDSSLGLSRRENTRLLVIVSDGRFDPVLWMAGQQRVDRLRAAGCAVLWLAPDRDSVTPFAGVTVHTLTDPATTAQAIARAAVAAVRDA